MLFYDKKGVIMQEKDNQIQELTGRLKLCNSMLLDAADTKATEKSIINAIRASLKKGSITLFNLAKFAVELDLYAIIELLQNKIGAKQELAYYAGIFDKTELFESSLLRQAVYLNKAVMGASEVGNIVLIDKLLARGAHIKWAVKGAASKNQVVTLKKLLRRVESGQRKMVMNMLEQGAKRSGNQELIDLLPARDQLVTPRKRHKFSHQDKTSNIDRLGAELVSALMDLKSNESKSPQTPSL